MQLGKPGAEVTKKLLGLHGKCRKPQLRKVVGARKIFLKFLPRNNKLSQVTVHVLIGRTSLVDWFEGCELHKTDQVFKGSLLQLTLVLFPHTNHKTVGKNQIPHYG